MFFRKTTEILQRNAGPIARILSGKESSRRAFTFAHIEPATCPAIVLIDDLRIADGNHRVAGFHLAGHELIPCRWKK